MSELWVITDERGREIPRVRAKMLKKSDRVTRAGNPRLHIEEFSGVITGFWRVNDSRMVQVCDGHNCILTDEYNLRLTPHPADADPDAQDRTG